MDFKEKQVDRLSNLPDSILIHILSFLPTRDAAKTVAIKPFGDLWTNIDSLDFIDTEFYDKNITWCDDLHVLDAYQKFARFVRHFITLHKNPTVNNFTLKFYETLGPLEPDADPQYLKDVHKLVTEVQTWVRFSISRRVEVLDLSFGDRDDGCMVDIFTVPYVVWTSPSLVELRLCNCNVGNLQKVKTSLLRVLVLHKVNLSDDEITNIIHNSPLLEDVSITDCFDLEFLSFTTPNVKTLRVVMEDDNYGEHWYLSVNCPNVTSFEYTGYGDCLKVINISSVKVATLAIQFGFCIDFLGYVELKRLLESFQHAEALKLDQQAFTVLIYHVVQNFPFLCNKWKRLEFNTTLNGKHILGICSLLGQLSYLEELIINVRDPIPLFHEEIAWQLYDVGDVWEYDWSSESSIPNLKTVTMHGSISGQIQLVKVILKNAPVLDKVCMNTKGDALPAENDPLPSHRLFEISKKLLSFPKASKQAIVSLL